MQTITNELWVALPDSVRQSLVIKAGVDDSQWEQNAIDMPFWHLPYPLKVAIREHIATPYTGQMIENLFGQVEAAEIKADHFTQNDNIAHDAAESVSRWAHDNNCYHPLLFSVVKKAIVAAMGEKP